MTSGLSNEDRPIASCMCGSARVSRIGYCEDCGIYRPEYDQELRRQYDDPMRDVREAWANS